MMHSLLAYFHALGLVLLFGGLLAEALFLRPRPDYHLARRLVFSDITYGVGAALLLLSGFARAAWTDKGGVEFYWDNPLFHLKLAVFTVVGLLSVYPTRQYLRWRRVTGSGDTPQVDDQTIGRMLILVRLELAVGSLIPLLAVLMARGIGRGM